MTFVFVKGTVVIHTPTQCEYRTRRDETPGTFHFCQKVQCLKNSQIYKFLWNIQFLTEPCKGYSSRLMVRLKSLRHVHLKILYWLFKTLSNREVPLVSFWEQV